MKGLRRSLALFGAWHSLHCLMRYAQVVALFESQIRAKCIENDLYLLRSAGVAVAVAVAVAVVVAATFA